MSYLNSPRLTFSGQFQADPSTVNNIPTYFDNSTFEPSFQEFQTDTEQNGLWNPEGTGSWRFVGCTIQSVTYKDGTSTSDPTVDAIIGLSIMDANTRVAGKIVDLDTQQQMVSMLWGLVVRIVGADGNDVMKGDYEPAAFTNIYTKAPAFQSISGAAASYQSVIKNITWDPGKLNSRYLNELTEPRPDKLSILFNVDEYDADHTTDQFTLGRITGSIGPAKTGEPDHFVMGRQLFPLDPACNFATAIVDEDIKTLVLDLGNALQFNMDGTVAESRQLTIGVDQNPSGSMDFAPLGTIDYSGADWYVGDAGICTFPLSGDNLKLAIDFPLVIVNIQPNLKNSVAPPTLVVIFQERPDYVCADQFVHRLNPTESCTVYLYATHLGKAAAGKTVDFQLDANIFGPTPPPVGIPDDLKTISFPSTSKETGTDGMTSIDITAGDPNSPRGYIDGQVYALTYNLDGQTFANGNQSNFISLLLFDGVPEATVNSPTWADIQPIMQQYANLYPLMSKGIFNLADQTVVDNNAEILKFVFSKKNTDPNYMPATRDLSRDKQQMIINYLNGVLAAQGPKETVTIRKP